MNPLRLLFGAGTSNWNSYGYTNVDIRKVSTVDVVCDLSKTLPWEDNSVDEIFAESIFEHIPMGQDYVNSKRVLKEWVRVLKSGAKITLKLQDMEKLCAEYLHGSKQTAINYLYGKQDYPLNTHVAGFSKEGIHQLLSEASVINLTFDATQPYEFKIIGNKK